MGGRVQHLISGHSAEQHTRGSVEEHSCGDRLVFTLFPRGGDFWRGYAHVPVPGNLPLARRLHTTCSLSSYMPGMRSFEG
jgi:hypothetical protein